MEDLYLHIEKLLANYDYAIVPHFGGFAVRREAARVLDNRIAPPQAVVGFNPLMNSGDGLLALALVRQRGITYRAASEIIEKEIERYKNRLAHYEHLPFGNLGSFSRQPDNSLLFTPVERFDFLPYNFCKNDIYFHNKKRIKKLPNQNFNAGRILRYAAALALLFGFSVIFPNGNNNVQTNRANLLNLNFTAYNQTDTNKNAVLKKTEEISVQEEIAAEATNDCIVEQFAHYEVITACLKSREAAENYCSKLKNAGLAQTHVLAFPKSYFVSACAFDSKTDAIEFMENLRQSGENFKTAWVLCQ